MTDFTYCIVTTGQRSPFVFCHYDITLEKAIEYAKQQMLERPVEYITIREGITDHNDPIVWDSRQGAKPEPTTTNGALFIKLLREFESAAVAKSWKGGQPPEDHAQIEQDYIKAKAALMNHVCNNIKD